jgi:hypothetical protein
MGSQRATPDQWTPLIEDRLRFFLGTDPLMGDGYQPAVEFGIDPDFDPEHGLSLLEVRTRASMPAGWRLQFLFGRRMYLPLVGEELRLIDTAQFRLEGDTR